MKKNLARVLVVLIAAALMLQGMAIIATAEEAKVRIGISWSKNGTPEDFPKYIKTIEEAGAEAVLLGQVTSSVVEYDEGLVILPEYIEESGMLKTEYAEGIKALDFSLTNVEEVMADIDGVFFVGGEDISPTLFALPQIEMNGGEDINATRDISDYTLMGYCIANDIPTYAACRGMQMMGIVSGCQFTQDIPTWYSLNGAAYNDTHRMPVGAENRTYARHDVNVIAADTHTAEIIGAESLANVSSWHHQGIVGIKDTDLVVTCTATYDGIEFIEGIERPELTFCVGTQFHPENDVYLHIQNGECPCDYDTCLRFFQALVEAAGAADAEAAA